MNEMLIKLNLTFANSVKQYHDSVYSAPFIIILLGYEVDALL